MLLASIGAGYAGIDRWAELDIAHNSIADSAALCACIAADHRGPGAMPDRG